MSESAIGEGVVTPPHTPSAAPRLYGIGATIRSIAGSVPTVLVLAGVGALGWWGHHSGWKLPKFSALTGRVPVTDDWCGEHGVPESRCVECNADLMPRPAARGWCKVHGVHECPLCHPELAQLTLPAVVTPDDLDRARRSLEFADRPANSAVCRLHRRRVQFADAAAVERAGVDVEPAWAVPVVEFVSAPGEIGYDRTRVAHLSARSPGSVYQVFKRLGDGVKAGDVLALIDAAEVGKAKAELLQAVAHLDLKTQTLANIKGVGVVPPARVRDEEAAVQEARVRVDAGYQALLNLGLPVREPEWRDLPAEKLKAVLQFAGIPPAVAGTLDRKTAPFTLLPVAAPQDGTVVSFEVVAGEVTDTARVLYEVADTRRLWVTLDATVEDARRLRVGLPVRFRPDGAKDETAATLAWVSTQADPKTRTVKLRAELPDPDGRHRANTFGAGRVILRDEPRAVVVPTAAVHWEGCCHVVFVRDKDYLTPDAPKVFHTRTVRVGAKDGTNTEVVAGVLPGELVAVKNSGVLRAELLRGDLGEG